METSSLELANETDKVPVVFVVEHDENFGDESKIIGIFSSMEKAVNFTKAKMEESGGEWELSEDTEPAENAENANALTWTRSDNIADEEFRIQEHEVH